MNIVTSCYMIYLFISIALTIWVARTLHRNGRIFLVDAFHGNENLADSVNHLLVVGFYLINVGYVTLALKYGDKPHSSQDAFEFLSTKVGLVLLILGGMHFFNVFNFAKMRRKSKHPVVAPIAAPIAAPVEARNDAVESLRRIHSTHESDRSAS